MCVLVLFYFSIRFSSVDPPLLDDFLFFGSASHDVRSTLSCAFIHPPGRQHYRLYTIRNIPSLKVLDYVKISKSERERAERLANSAAGAALEADVQGEQSSSSTLSAKTFVPGEGLDAQKTFTAIFTREEKEWIRDLVANAASAAEIEEIEQSVQRGVLPPQLLNRKRPPDEESGLGPAIDPPPAKKSRNGET